MVAVKGKYKNGQVTLNKEVAVSDNSDVIVTFLEEEDELPAKSKRLTFEDFSFAESREALKDYKGSFSDTVIDERRNSL